jgi:hypothetical protein
MTMRIVRAGAGLLLVASGALMYAASWQRWARSCPWGVTEGGSCDGIQDHRYDFIAPSAPWEPVGDAAELAGWSLLVLALAFVLLPWALTGRRPGLCSAVALVAAVLALGAVGVASLRSGRDGSVVPPVGGDLALLAWSLLPPALLIRFAAGAQGWAAAAAVWLVLASPLLAAFSYAVGPYDSRPWWEAISGGLTVTGGLCLLVAAAFPGVSGAARLRRTHHHRVLTVTSASGGPGHD